MPPVDLPVDKGENTIMDSKRLPPGFLELLDGWVYMPGDPDQLHKIPGRSQSALMPTGVTTANAKGIVHLQYDNGTNVIVILGNSLLHEASAGDTLGAWSTVQDPDGTDFDANGSYLRAVADGANRWIVWTGAEDERALIRDEDGNWRRLGMLQPVAPTLTAVLSGAVTPNVEQFDTFALAPVGIYETGATDRQFTSEALAVDDGADDKYATFAQDTTVMRADGKGARDIAGTRFSFTAIPAAADASGHQLSITLDLSLGTAGDPQPLPIGAEGSALGFRGQFSIELYDDAQSPAIPIHKTKLTAAFVSANRSDENNGIRVTFELDKTPAGGEMLWTNLQLDIKWHYTKGSQQVTAMVRDIRFIEGGIIEQDTVEAGTYEYAITEVHQVALASGDSFLTESPPSTQLAVTLASGTANAIDLLMPTSLSNQSDTGYAVADMVFNIYRSTKTGAWPNLGLIATISADSEFYRDTFDVSPSTLGVPSVRTVSVGGVFSPQAGLPPPIYDATLFRGALVLIPEAVRRSLKWGLPNQPDAMPFFQDIRTLPSERNDALVGVTNLNDMLLVFLRTRVLRIRLLPNATAGASFDLTGIEIDSLSPDEGLAGGPRAYTTFKTETGRGMAAWTSDNGAWMTDGSLAQERGLGVRKLTRNMNWRGIVDVSALSTAVMTYDPVLQIIYLDCDGLNGNRLTLLLHTSPSHWVGEGESGTPKTSRTTDLVALDRVVGEDSAVLKHWSLYTQGATAKVLLERNGIDDDGSNIDSFGRFGWNYLAAPQNGFMLWKGILAHQDWGTRGMLEVNVETRRDETGITQDRRSMVPMRGNRTTQWLISRGGQAAQLSFRHKGKTVSTGVSPLAVGPFAVLVDPMGEITDD